MYGTVSKLLCGVVASGAVDIVKEGVPRKGMYFVTRNGLFQGGDISNRGDSGAPVFDGNVALGLISGGNGVDTIVSPISNLAPLGVSILTQ